MAVLLFDDFNNLSNITTFTAFGTVTNPASIVRVTLTGGAPFDTTGWRYNTGILAKVGDTMFIRARIQNIDTRMMVGLTTNAGLSIGNDAANAYFTNPGVPFGATQLFINTGPIGGINLVHAALQWYDFRFTINAPGLIQLHRKLDSEPDSAYVLNGFLATQGSFVGFDGNTINFQCNVSQFSTQYIEVDFVRYERPDEGGMPLGVRSSILRDRPGLKPRLKVGG